MSDPATREKGFRKRQAKRNSLARNQAENKGPFRIKIIPDTKTIYRREKINVKEIGNFEEEE